MKLCFKLNLSLRHDSILLNVDQLHILLMGIEISLKGSQKFKGEGENVKIKVLIAS